jgi:hypothetical protein
MINLSVQDSIDGLGKIQMLREAIGKNFSDNYSSTSRSELVSVSKCGNVCYTKEVKGEYSKNEPKPGLKKEPSWLTWNGLFY